MFSQKFGTYDTKDAVVAGDKSKEVMLIDFIFLSVMLSNFI